MRSFLLVALLGYACNGVAIKNRAEGTAKLENDKSGSEKPSDADPNKPENAPEAKETVSIPKPVSGSYLTCVSSDSGNQSSLVVSCAFRDEATAQNIPLASSYKSYGWSMKPQNGYTASVRELPVTNAYQAEFTITSSVGPIQDRTLSFHLDLISLSDEKISAEAPLNFHFTRWAPANGEQLPPHAIISGSENSRAWMLYTCRMIVGGEVRFGKAYEQMEKPNLLCLAEKDGKSIRSNDEATGALVNRFDVLVMDDDHQFLEVLEWVASDKVVPELQFISENDSKGRPIYPCRASNPSDPNFEPTPGGYDHNYPNWCGFEFGGGFGTQIYEVLQWKSARAKASFEAAKS